MLPLRRPAFAHQKNATGRRIYLSKIDVIQRRAETYGLGHVCPTVSEWKEVI